MDAVQTATLNASIVAINASPLSPADKASMLEQIVMAALAQQATGDATAISVIAQTVAQQADVAALAQVRPDAASGLGAQTDLSQSEASTFVPTDPTDDDLGNPPGYANRMFTLAGYANVNAADGPDERWGSLVASRGGATDADPSTLKAGFKQAVVDIIATYAAGTANMQTAPSTQQTEATGFTSGGYTDDQKMTMLYIAANGPGRTKAMAALDLELGGDGVHQNLKYTALDQMTGGGAAGNAPLYDPDAQSAMSQLAQGSTVAVVSAQFTKFAATWFELAEVIVARYA